MPRIGIYSYETRCWMELTICLARDLDLYSFATS